MFTFALEGGRSRAGAVEIQPISIRMHSIARAIMLYLLAHFNSYMKEEEYSIIKTYLQETWDNE